MVNCVTVLKNELFVVLKNSSSDIRVYNSTTYDFLRTISVPKMSNLFDIVSYEDAIFVISCYDANKVVCSKEGNTNLTLDFENFKNECITIVKVQSPNMAASIWAVDVTESNPTIMFGGQFGQSFTKRGFRQKQTNPGHHASISLTKHGNLLVCCSTDNVLTEYTRNGSFVRKISFRLDGFSSNQVFRAFHLYDDLFLVQNDNRLHLLDSYGIFKSMLGDYHVSVDRKGLILVNDRKSNKLVSLSSSLVCVETEIIPQLANFSNNLLKMYLDERAGRLYLNDDNSCGLLILQFLKIWLQPQTIINNYNYQSFIQNQLVNSCVTWVLIVNRCWPCCCDFLRKAC